MAIDTYEESLIGFLIALKSQVNKIKSISWFTKTKNVICFYLVISDNSFFILSERHVSGRKPATFQMVAFDNRRVSRLCPAVGSTKHQKTFDGIRCIDVFVEWNRLLKCRSNDMSLFQGVVDNLQTRLSVVRRFGLGDGALPVWQIVRRVHHEPEIEKNDWNKKTKK